MTLTIQITPELEARLLQQAARVGMDVSQFVVSTLASRLEQSAGPAANCGQEEAAMLAAINQGLPETLWRRYRELVSHRQSDSLSAAEHTELIRLSNEVEVDHARRLEYAARLAQLRNVPLANLVEQLGIRQPHA